MSVFALLTPLNTGVFTANVTTLSVDTLFFASVNGGGVVALHRISHLNTAKIRLK